MPTLSSQFAIRSLQFAVHSLQFTVLLLQLSLQAAVPKEKVKLQRSSSQLGVDSQWGGVTAVNWA